MTENNKIRIDTLLEEMFGVGKIDSKEKFNALIEQLDQMDPETIIFPLKETE